MHTRRLTWLYLACLFQLAACGSSEQPKQRSSPNTTAAGHNPCGQLDHFACFFMPLAGSAGIMEVELGKIAARRSASPPVKAYAEQMVREHSAINEEYRNLMRRKGLTPPDGMLREQQLKVDSLNNSSAADLDPRYVAMMVNDHSMAVKLFDMAYDSAQDAEYREWLGRMRQVVRMHQQHAVALRDGAMHH